MCTKTSDDFPITRNYVFLNHASVSPLPRVAKEALQEYAVDSAEHGWAHREQWGKKTNSARNLIAAKLGADPVEIAFTQNTTSGIAMIANGLDWQPGDNVVLADVEYPANVYPWWAQEQRGVEIRWVKPGNGRLRLEDYFAAADERTRVITVSSVQFATGFRINLDKLGTFCHDRGILLVVDAIQSFGALPINVRTSRIDSLACGVHKWLLSPIGLGFLYCERGLAERLKVWTPGAESVVRANEFLNYDLTYADGVKRFEGGSFSLPSIYALEAVLRMMNEAGEDRIERKIKTLTDRLCSGLVSRGYLVFSSRQPNEWSGIVIFQHEKHESAEIVETLMKNNILTCVRESRVRVSPHFYNTEEEIDTLLAALP